MLSGDVVWMAVPGVIEIVCLGDRRFCSDITHTPPLIFTGEQKVQNQNFAFATFEPPAFFKWNNISENKKTHLLSSEHR